MKHVYHHRQEVKHVYVHRQEVKNVICQAAVCSEAFVPNYGMILTHTKYSVGYLSAVGCLR